jgi:predicted nucleotidyltransferase
MKRPLTENEKAALRELKERLTRDFQLVEMRLFGSRAREEGDAESDMDVLVILPRDDWDTNMAIYDVCFDLDLKYDVVLSCIIYSEADYNSPLNRITGLYREVEREGIRL